MLAYAKNQVQRAGRHLVADAMPLASRDTNRNDEPETEDDEFDDDERHED